MQDCDSRLPPVPVSAAALSSPPARRDFFRRALPCLLVLAAAQPARAADGDSGSPADPRLLPERIVLNLTPAPATSVAVTWRTAAKPARAIVQVARATAAPTLADQARKVEARSDGVATDPDTTVWHHSAVLPDLIADTLYAYRVGDGVVWGEWSQFRTAKASPAPFRFLYFGDPQNGIREYCTRVFRAGYAKAPDSAFYLIAGDMVTTTIADNLWGELFHALAVFAPNLPGLNTPGNHDYGQFVIGGRKVRTASPLYRAHFTQPENGPVGLEETTYYVDYQGVRLITLNGNERLEDQVAWLDQLLARNPNRWTIVLMHQPVYSTGKSRDNPKLRAALLPVYDKHAVDLVLQGHDHSYGRTFKLRGGQRVAEDERGTVYCVSMSGPKFYPVNPQHAALMARIDTGVQLFQVISVEADKLRYESWTVTGELHDAFELTKPAVR